MVKLGLNQTRAPSAPSNGDKPRTSGTFPPHHDTDAFNILLLANYATS